MDSFAKQIYWKAQKRQTIINIATLAMKVIGAFLTFGGLVMAAPLAESGGVTIDRAIDVIVWVFTGAVFWSIAVVAYLAAMVMKVDLKCAHCKHSLDRHEERDGRTHNCKGWHLVLSKFRVVRCVCPAFIPAGKP